MPNVRALTAESFTLFALNHTGAWLAAKTAEEQRVIVEKARKAVPALRSKFKERQVNIC